MKLSIGMAINRYLEWCALRAADETIRTYNRSLATFFRDVIGDPVASLTPDRMEAITINARSAPSGGRHPSGKPNKGSTFLGKLRIAKRFTKWVHAHGYTQADALADLPAIPAPRRRHKEVLRTDEVQALIAVPDPLRPEQARDRAMIATLYCTGVRIGELAEVRLRDISPMDDAEFDVTVRAPEKGGKIRRVQVWEFAAFTLDTYLRYDRQRLIGDHESTYAFPNRTGAPFSYHAFRRQLKLYGEAIGLPFAVNPHLFRHSLATHLGEQGWNAFQLRVDDRHGAPARESLHATSSSGSGTLSVRQLQKP